jgi:gliding motility-associated protein GldE
MMVLLLICSALVSGSEVAFFSLNPGQTEDLQQSTDKSSTRVVRLLEHPDRESASKQLLATILIANNFINIAIVLMSTFVAQVIIPERLPDWQELLLHVGAVTFVIVLFGEVIPKVYATSYNVQLARFMSPPLGVLKRMVRPLSHLLIRSTTFIDRNKNGQGSTSISVDELGHALELTNDDERSDEEQKILEGIVSFGSKDAKQIMTNRMDVTAFSSDISFKELIEGILDAGYSRIPIYTNSLDEIEGILYIKDLLPHLYSENFHWQQLVRSPFVVPENKKIDDLLREFQGRKIHLAIVVDEYGGTSGIISLEDIIEEIVGEITDEFDDDDLQYTKIDEGIFVFEGKTPLIDVYRIMEIDGALYEAAKGDSDTLAGFVIEQAGKIPVKGERISFEELTFTVEAADKRKVKRVKVVVEDQTNENGTA